MRAFLPKVLALVCFLTFGFAEAQVYYSVNPRYLRIKTESNNLVTPYRYQYPDTSINALHMPFPVNFLGNTGLPSPRYILRYGESGLGFRVYDTPNESDRFTDEQVTYYRSIGPYADFTGIAGSRKFQAFKMLFTHTFKDRVNISLRFNRYSSLGFYAKQQSYVNNFYLSSNATAKKGRSGYYLYILNNGNRHSENGGLLYELSPVTLTVLKEALPVKLNAASRDNRELKFMINPWLRLNRDTSGTLHFLQLKSGFRRNIYQYKDARLADNFYDLVYLDTLETNDSACLRQLSNGLNYVLKTSNRQLQISAGYRHELNRVWQKNDSLFFNQLVTGAVIWRRPLPARDSAGRHRELSNEAGMEYVSKGANTGDYRLENRLNYVFDAGRNRRVYVNFLALRRHPDYIYNYWVSNHFRWFNNGYLPQSQLQLKAGLELGKTFSASAFFQNLENYLYFDQYALPRQYAGRISNTGLSVTFSHILFRHLGVYLDHVYQHTSHSALVRLPPHISTSRLFYHGIHFRNNLQVQAGLQLRLYGAFAAYDYMPATQAFYLQEGFETTTYPFVDAYLNIRIRPVSVFVKMENLLQSYAGTSYAMVPGYYQPDLAIRFGITWIFFD